MLGAYETQAVRGARRRTADGGARAGSDRRPVCGGGSHPRTKAQCGEKTRLSIDARQADRRAILRLDQPAVRGAGFATEQSTDQGPGLCPRATIWPGGLSERPGRADRYQPSRTRIAGDSDGPEKLDVLLD